MAQVSWTLADAQNFLAQAQSTDPTTALKLLEKADSAVQDVMMADPGNAGVFLTWGHIHKLRARLYKTANPSEVADQLQLAIDMYDSALNINGGLVEAKRGIEECKSLK